MLSHVPARLLIVVVLLVPSIVPAEEPALETENQQILYALGLAMSQNLKPFAFEADEVSIVQAGLADGILGHEARVDLAVFGPKIDGMLRARLAEVAERERAAGQLFLEEVAQQEGAVASESGLVYIELEAGAGEIPETSSIVKLHYHGTLRDGSVFDSSRLAGEPATIPIAQMPACMRESVGSMRVGGKRKVYCPPDLAYGDEGRPPLIPPAAVLVLELELVGIVEAAPPPEPAAAAPSAEPPSPLP